MAHRHHRHRHFGPSLKHPGPKRPQNVSSQETSRSAHGRTPQPWRSAFSFRDRGQSERGVQCAAVLEELVAVLAELVLE